MRRIALALSAFVLTGAALAGCEVPFSNSDSDSAAGSSATSANKNDCKLITAAEAKAALATDASIRPPMFDGPDACIIGDTTGDGLVETVVKRFASATEADAHLQDNIDKFTWMRENGSPDNLDGSLTKPIPGTSRDHLHCNTSNALIDVVKGTSWVRVTFYLGGNRSGTTSCDKETMGRLRTLAVAVVGRV